MSKALFFSSPTCAPCKALKMDLAAAGVGKELTYIDVSQRENADLLAEYGVRSVPTVVFLDDAEEIVRIRIGYTGDIKDYVEMFK